MWVDHRVGGHFSADIPFSEIEMRGFRLERVPTQIGEQVRVFAVE